MLIEGDPYSLTKAFTYAPRKIIRLGIWGLTRKSKWSKVGGISIACAAGKYKIYRLIFPTDVKIDGFIRGLGFTCEKFVNDTNVEVTGLKLSNRWIGSEAIRKFVCRVVLE